MDIGSVIGIIAAYGLIVFTIGSQLVLFVSIPSALIVLGGTDLAPLNRSKVNVSIGPKHF
jgi:chemotaxis protein MotA